MPITSFFTAILGILFVVLTLFVIYRRFRAKIDVGDGGDKNLVAVIRTHGNFIEYAPFFLIMMAMVENNGGFDGNLVGFGYIFFFGRIFHALGMANVYHARLKYFRQVGFMASTIAFIGVLVMLVMQIQGY